MTKWTNLEKLIIYDIVKNKILSPTLLRLHITFIKY